MGSVGAQSLSDLYRDAESGSSLGSGWARTFTEWSLCYLHCVLRVTVLLEDETSSESEVQSAVEQVIIEDVSVRVQH